MKKYLAALSLLFIFITANAQDLGCGVSVIPEKSVSYGCGCNYYTNNHGKLAMVFQSELDASNPRMFINGALVNVERLSAPDLIHPQAGDNFSEKFKYQSTEIGFYNTINFVCPPENEGCELISYDTTILITDGQCKTELTEYNGDCGC